METIWFLLWGLLWGIYFLLDGYDLGVGMLMPFLAKNEKDRHKVIASIGPFWDGNEVWLITAGGVTFAAFPGTYATMFSALYSPLMLILFALIMRGAGLALREEVDSSKQRSLWDGFFVVGSFGAALLFGVAFANLFRGIPIDAQGVFQGNLLTLLNPYGLIGGVLFLVFFLLHGALWLSLKTEGQPHDQASKLSKRLWIVLVVITVLFLVVTRFWTNLYDNYLDSPLLLVLPVLAVVCLLLAGIFISKADWSKSWYASSGFILFTTLFGITGMYPDLLISSIDQSFSRTIQNSASSTLTLTIMLVVVLIFIPLVIIYQAWAYRLFKGKVNGGYS